MPKVNFKNLNGKIKFYTLMKKFETPCTVIDIGVTKTEREWMDLFKDLEWGECEIKNDWFKPTIGIRIMNLTPMEHGMSVNGLYCNYHLKTNIPIPDEKIVNIKNLIESYLNNEEIIGIIGNHSY